MISGAVEGVVDTVRSEKASCIIKSWMVTILNVLTVVLHLHLMCQLIFEIVSSQIV